jgi:acetyltransferase
MPHRTMPLIRTPKSGKFHPDFLFRPRAIAVVGSGTAAGQEVLGNVLAGGFAGPVLTAATPGEIDRFETVPDLAIVCADPGDVPAAFLALGRRGTTVAILTTMTADLPALVAESGVRAYGPGSFGIAVPGIKLCAIRSHLRPRPGRAALLSQSAALCRAVLDWAEPNGVGFSHIVGVGGNQDLGFFTVLDWLSRDPDTGVILLDIRRIRDPRRFLSAARAAAHLRPVVAIRPGVRLLDSDGGADAVLRAALDRVGVLSVDTFDGFLAAAETLTRARPPRNESLAIVTNAIGPARLAADAALRAGLTLADLAPETREILHLTLPPDSVGREIAYVGADQPTRAAEVAALLAGAREVGGVLIVHAPTGAGDDVAMRAITASAKAIRVPMLVCAMGETTGAAHRRALAEAGVAVFATPEQAVRGFGQLVQNRRNRAAARELPPSTVLRLAPDRAEVTRLFRRARAAGRTTLAQGEAMSVLAAYGIPAAPFRVAMSPADAADAAAMLGFPAVIKRRRDVRPDAESGSEAAGPGSDWAAALALDLRDPAQVLRAAERLEARRPPDAPIGFLVQRQVGRARELLVRIAPDPVFGPTIAFGQGGTAAKAFSDIAFDLPPLNLSLARALIARTRVAATLAALRDAPAAHVDAVADTLVRVSQLVVDFPEIAELDINPLFADQDGVLVADAWLRLHAADATPPRLALPPYPAELSAPFQAGPERVLIRPIRPEDAEAHVAFFAHLSPEDIRYRFFSAIRELTPERIARMTQIDYDREMAFIAVRESTSETLGVSRLVAEGDGGEGEFAIVVRPDMKGRGLASHLMRRLFDWARTRGITDIVGQILADNAPMLSFVRHLGFEVKTSRDEPGVMEARFFLPSADSGGAVQIHPPPQGQGARNTSEARIVSPSLGEGVR